MELAYKRVSTSDQNTARQLVGVDIDRDFVDIASGKNTERPQLQALLQMVRADDVIHIHELSRLGRSVKDLLEIVEQIVVIGASVKFHKENLIFSSNSKNSFQSLMLNLLSSIAQFERDLLLERQREGIEIAKKLGKFTGKKSRFTHEELIQIKEDFKSTKSKKKLAEKLGISRSYLYELVKNGEKKQLKV
jgi:DNA invertase Pin-like site-specific DNA recombinase